MDKVIEETLKHVIEDTYFKLKNIFYKIFGGSPSTSTLHTFQKTPNQRFKQ